MSDEESLRRLAREAIAAERIPAGRPKGTWGGNGTDAFCDICGLLIRDDEIGFEVEFSQEAAGARPCRHLHSACFAAWEFERHTLEAGDRPKGANGRTPVPGSPHGARSHAAADTECLSVEDKAGSMPDRECSSKGQGGSA